MSRQQLTLACIESDRTRPLLDGRVKVDGADVRCIAVDGTELFRRQGRDAEFEIAEFSTCTLMALHGRGDRRLVGIPVFPSRNFRHANFFVNVHAGVEGPHDLVGKRVGCAEWVQTAALWIRAFLKHDYGVDQEQIVWILNAKQVDRIEFELPKTVAFERAPEGVTLGELLDRGGIDALMSAEYPQCFVNGSPNVRRLFPNFKQVEMDYYRRTGFHPIMHLVVLTRDVYEENPLLAQSVQKAFHRARDIALTTLYQSYGGILSTILPLLISAVEETRTLMGDDVWPYGFPKNRHMLEAMTQYAYEQGITDHRISAEELFASETLRGIAEGKLDVRA